MAIKGVDIAKTFIGKQEVRDRKELMSFLKSQAKNNDISIDPSTTSWCAAFVNACERKAGYNGTGKLNAQSFRTYGQSVNFDEAQEGDIIVFHFPFDKEWQGHVSYFVEWDDDNNTVICLGGNQSNMVCYSHYVQDYVTDIRRS